MFRLFKVLVGLVGLAAFLWFGLTVPLGDKTLFGHLRSIGNSKETEELVRGTKEAAGRAWGQQMASHEAGTDKTKADVAAPDPHPAAKEAEARTDQAHQATPQDHLTTADQKEMRRLIHSAHRNDSH